MKRSFENLFKEKHRKTKHEYNEFLRDISLPTLSQEKKKVCNEEINEQEVILAMKSFSNNKYPGNVRLAKELYEIFWEELEQSFMNSLNQAKVSKKLKANSNKIIRKEGQR